MKNHAVISLQIEASESDVNVSNLLRKAYLIASKLDLDSTEHWISSELNGYDENTAIPDYRRIACDMRVFNPMNGINMPVVFPTPEERKRFSTVKISQSIPNLQYVVDRQEDLYFDFTPGVAESLMSIYGFPSKPRRHISKSSVQNILSEVQNTILNWSIDLEKNGILGEGLVFSEDEVSAAATGPTISVSGGNVSIVGSNYGTVHNTQNLSSLIPAINSTPIHPDAKKRFESLANEWDHSAVGNKDNIRQKIKQWLVDNIVGIGSLGLQISNSIQ